MTRNGALVSYLPSWDVFLLATEGAQGNGEVGIETVQVPRHRRGMGIQILSYLLLRRFSTHYDATGLT